jgi:hypothetical protein
MVFSRMIGKQVNRPAWGVNRFIQRETIKKGWDVEQHRELRREKERQQSVKVNTEMALSFSL